MGTKRKSPIYRHFIEAIIILGVLLVINLIAGFKFFRVDLTEDKIHTLHEKTKEFLTEIDDVVNIEIYLTGDDLPPEVMKFRNSIKDKLEEFQAYAGNNLKYKFVDILADSAMKNSKSADFQKKGVTLNVFQKMENGALKDYQFYPIIQLRYKSNVYMVDFMPAIRNEDVVVSPYYIEQQKSAIEYKLVTGLHHVTGQPKPQISFLLGHGEVHPLQRQYMTKTLKEFYNVDSVFISKMDKETNTMKEDIDALDETDLLFVAKPFKSFTDKELFIIDQFIMRGGRTIWAIDMINPHEDSLFFPIPFTKSSPQNQLDNVEKMLYRYGAGIKKNFITNSICAGQVRHDIRQTFYEGQVRSNPYFMNYYYYSQNINNHIDSMPVNPVIKKWYPYACVTKENSVLTHNLGRVKLNFPSTINENLGAPSKKTIILETDASYKEFPAITRIYYDKNKVVPNFDKLEVPGHFFDPKLGKENPTNYKAPLAILLEGTFKSNFPLNTLDAKFVEGMKTAGIKYHGEHTDNAMAIIGDGDIIKDEYIVDANGAKFINIDKDYIFSNELVFGNTKFIHNLIDQMTGNDHLIPLRSRMDIPRFLDRDAIFYDRGKWQAVNLIIPSIIVLLLGGLQFFLRKRRATN